MPDVQTVTITYQYRTPSLEYLTYTSTIEKNTKFIVERAPFNIAGKRIVKYTSTSGTYLPGQLATAFSNMTLTVPQEDGLEDIGYVKVHQGNTTVDISDMVVNIVEKMGKNQPFSYVVISVLKELFIDANLTLEQKSTIFDVNVYGIVGSWTYERLEDNGSTYDITIVNKAYYLKTTTLLSLLNFTLNNAGNRITFTNIEPSDTSHAINWTLNPSSNTEYGRITFSKTGITTVSFTIKRVNIATTESPEYTYALIKIDGSPDNIFKFICNAVAGYTSFNIEAGIYHSKDPDVSYTTAQIEEMGSYTIYEAIDIIFNSISLRLDQYCWNILETIALFTDRYICFDSNANLYPRDMNYNKYVIVDWEAPDPISSMDDYRHILALSSNDDQGSQYVLASQKVICEAYETTVSISDTNSTDVGADIVFASPDNTKIDITQTDNETRDTQARIIALNSIVRNYKPGDCVTYSICETVYPTTTLEDVTDLDNVPAPSGADQCFKYVSTLEGSNIVLHESYFVSQLNGASYVWVEYDTDNPKREKAYNYRTCAYSVEDRQNNITILNAPIAMIQTEYPACVTTYTWGMPEFMDEQSQFKDLAAVAQDSVLDNTGDTQISSSDASKIVVGNQSISDLRSDRSGFTGLILEKNVDNQVYRLAGYNEGLLQAEFNSSGEIQSGGGNVVINYDGITLHGGVDIDLVDNTSKIIANKVILDHTGLNAYTSVVDGQGSGLKVSIGDDGNIVAGSGAVKLGVIPAGNNVNYNFATYNNGTVQCYVDSNGNIVSGGTVILNSNGLTGYYTTPISSANRSIVVSKTGTIAIGGNAGRTLQITGGQIQFYANGSVINSDGSVTGNLGASIDQNGWITIGDNTVSTAAIVDQAIVEAKLDDDSVSTDKIKALAVTTAKIDNLAVTNAKIDNIAAGKIETGTLSADCRVILSNTGSELLAGPYTPLVHKEVSSTISTVSSVYAGSYFSFEVTPATWTNIRIDSIAYNPTYTPSSEWLIQQSEREYGGIIPSDFAGNMTITIKYLNTSTQAEGTSLLLIGSVSPSTVANLAYRVRLNKDGLFTYNSSGTQVCSVGTDGNISGITISADKITSGVLSINSKIYLENSSSAILAGKFTYGGTTHYRVRIDGDGLKTYSSNGLPACSVDSTGNIAGITIDANQINTSALSSHQISLTNSGSIVAGGGNVVLNASGISINQSNVVLDSNGLSIDQGNVHLDSDGLSIMYNPSTSGYSPYDALKFVDKVQTSNVPFRLYYDPSSRTAKMDTQPIIDSGTSVGTAISIAYGDGAVEFDVANSTIQIDGSETSGTTTLTLLTSDASKIYPSTRFDYNYDSNNTYTDLGGISVYSPSLGGNIPNNGTYVSGPSPIPSNTVQCPIIGGVTASPYGAPFIVGCSGVGGSSPYTQHNPLQLKYNYIVRLNNSFVDNNVTYSLSAISSATLALYIDTTGNFTYDVEVTDSNNYTLYTERVAMVSTALQPSSSKTIEIPLANLSNTSSGSFGFTVKITSVSMYNGNPANPAVGWISYVDTGLYDVSAEYTYQVTGTYIRYAQDSQNISYKAYKLLNVYNLNKTSNQRMVLAKVVGGSKQIIQTFDTPAGFILDHDATLSIGAISNVTNPTSTSCGVSYLVQNGVGGHIGVSPTGVELNGDTRIMGGDFAQVKDSSGDRGNALFDVTGFSVESTFSSFKSPAIALMGAVTALGSLNVVGSTSLNGSISMDATAKNTLKDRTFEYNTDYGNDYIILVPDRWNGTTRVRYGIMICWGISERNGRYAYGSFHRVADNRAFASTPSVSAMGMDDNGSGGDDYTASLSSVSTLGVTFSVPDFVERVHWIAIGLI